MSFSPAYHRALKEAQAHHQSSKTYSGKFLRPHAPAIKHLIERWSAKSLLDYGCGKGRQYEWVSHGEDASIPKGMTIEQYWGIPVTKYDPAYPPFAAEPKGPDDNFDLVICTHVLGSIPTADLPAVFEDLISYAGCAVYIAEKIGPVRKQVFSAPTEMPRWTQAEWRAHLGRYLSDSYKGAESPEVWLATREKTERGVITKLEQVK